MLGVSNFVQSHWADEHLMLRDVFSKIKSGLENATVTDRSCFSKHIAQ